MGIVSAAVAIIVVLLELKLQVTAWFPLRREIKAIKKKRKDALKASFLLIKLNCCCFAFQFFLFQCS